MAGDKSTKSNRALNIFSLDGRIESYHLAKWPQFTVSNLSSKTTKSAGKNGSESAKFKITPESMAAAGFHAKPIEGSEDNACCDYCKKNLDGWGPNDVAWDEHVLHSRECPLVNLGEQVNRELTFTMASWPHSGKVGPSKMAKAGFFYWPKYEKDDDTAICVQCGLALDGWEPEDDPRHEHSRRRPTCPFLVTGSVHSPAHFELLFASRNTDLVMREWIEKDTTAKISSVKKRSPAVGKKVEHKEDPKIETTASKPKPAPKFKVPATKPNNKTAVVSKVIEAPRFETPSKKPTIADQPSAQRTRTSSRRSSMRHALSESMKDNAPLPVFKVPDAIGDFDPRISGIFSMNPSVDATPTMKRTAVTRKSRETLTLPKFDDPPKIDCLKISLDEISKAEPSFKITDDELDLSLESYLKTMIGKKLAAFDGQLTQGLIEFDHKAAILL